MNLPKATEEKKLDLRIRDKYLREEKLDLKEVEKHLNSLVDDSHNLKSETDL